MKTAYFVGVLAAIFDISVATPNLHNGIPGSIDGLFFIENDSLKKNMAQREDGKAILSAPDSADDSQLWYFELSEDKVHVAIKNYKFKRDAIDHPDWLLYELIENAIVTKNGVLDPTGTRWVYDTLGPKGNDHVQFLLRLKTNDVDEYRVLVPYGTEYLTAADVDSNGLNRWNIRLQRHETPQLSNGILGSVDGLFFIQNEQYQRNMMIGDDARVILAAQGTTFNENQLWYFELSKDRKHVAIKSYKYKEHAFNNPEWFLYELIPTKTKNQFRIMLKSNRNTLVGWGGYVDKTPLNDPDAWNIAWNIIFYRYSIKDKAMNGEFYIRNSQPSHNLPNVCEMHGEYICVPERRPYNKHLSTMAKLTCAGEDQDPARAAIFETSSLFNTAQL